MKQLKDLREMSTHENELSKKTKKSFFNFSLREVWFFMYQPLQVPVSLFEKIKYEFEETGEIVICYYVFNLCIYKNGLLKR